MLATCAQVVGRHRGMFPGQTDPDDLIQEAALYALRAAPRFDHRKSSPSTFTWTAAHRRLIDLQRAKKFSRTHEQLTESQESGVICADDLSARIERALELSRLLLGDAHGQRRTHPIYKLCACLIIRAGMRQSSRSFQLMLPTIAVRLGLRRTPGRRTFDRAARAIKRRIRECRRHAAHQS